MTLQEKLIKFATEIKESINCSLPARVVQVNNDGTVNVVAIRNDEIDDCVITVPIIRTETQRAYIALKIKAGDKGTIKFCDKSIENYRLTGSEENNGDKRVHSLSDGLFELGFLPDNERFEFPDSEIVIGLKNKTFTLSVDENGNLTITSPTVKIKAQTEIEGNTMIKGDLHITGTTTSDVDVVSGAISLKTHLHGGVMGGNSKTGVPE